MSSALRPPAGLRVNTYRDQARLTWEAVPAASGYRVYEHKGLEWEPAGEQTTQTACTVRMDEATMRQFAVVALGADGRESRKSRSVSALRLRRPWGLAIARNGRRLLRDAARPQVLVERADGSAVGPAGYALDGGLSAFDLAVDPRGRVLNPVWAEGVAGFVVQRPDLKLAYRRVGPEGSGPGQLRKPMGIGTDSHGYIFVADTGNDRLAEYTPDGRFLRVIGEGELRQPMKVTFDAADRLYVADSGNNRVAVYTREPDGGFKLSRSLGGPKEPVCALVDAAGRVYASANREAGIMGLDSSGKRFWKYEGEPDAPLSGPRGLAFDGCGNLLIMDEATLRIMTVKLPAG